jgi:hypothetical protein
MLKYLVILLSVVLLGLTACEEVDNTYTGPIQVQFVNQAETYYVLDEVNSTYEVQIKLVGQQQDVAKQIEFEVLDSVIFNGKMAYTTATLGDGVDIPNLTATVPAGESFASLSINGFYNDLVVGEVDTIMLGLVGGDLEAAVFNNVCLVKVQAYYAYNPDEFVGHWSGTFTNAIDFEGGTPTSPGLTIIKHPTDPNRLIISEGFYQEQIDSWGEFWTDGPFPVEIYMNDADPNSFKVEIPFWQYIGTTNDTWDYGVKAYPTIGTFNAVTKSMTIIAYGTVYGEETVNDIVTYNISLDGKGKTALSPIPLMDYPERVK